MTFLSIDGKTFSVFQRLYEPPPNETAKEILAQNPSETEENLTEKPNEISTKNPNETEENFEVEKLTKNPGEDLDVERKTLQVLK